MTSSSRKGPLSNGADAGVEQLADFIARYPRITVLTGAGCSTGSGIPDYRDDDGKWKHKQPMRYAQFVGELRNRRRYWAQSFAGWERVSRAQPNPAHHALSDLENLGRIACLVTQNVDGLHRKAGSRAVIDLHGVLDQVRCVGCSDTLPRDALQVQLRALNPNWQTEVERLAPDGDAKLSPNDFRSFEVPECSACGGILKPDVVFFGESVPKARVDAVHAQLDASDALFVVGSSLMVYSGYRFALAARKTGKPILIVNRGKTRADDLASTKISGDCGDLLSRLAKRISPQA